MNSVSLIGKLIGEPRLGTNRGGADECTMRLAVPRRNREGRLEPGVVYIDVSAFGEEAKACAERLSAGDRVGLSGRLDEDHPHNTCGESDLHHAVLIDQLDLL